MIKAIVQEVQEPPKTQEIVSLAEDFYAMAYLGYKKDLIEELQISTQLQGRNFYACLWVYLVELTLIAVIFKTVVFDVEGTFYIVTPNIEVFITRFLAGLLLHMELIEDVRQGLNMIKYLNTHPEEFTESFAPFILAFMQASGGFLAELTNMFMLATRQSVEYCITFFVAFHVLTAIDNIYAEALGDFSLREACNTPLKFKRKPKDIKYQTRSCQHKCIRVVYKALLYLNNAVYYYFVPFGVNLIPLFSPGATAVD